MDCSTITTLNPVTVITIYVNQSLYYPTNAHNVKT